MATGLSHGHRPVPEHAERAVRYALEKADLSRANGLILFLSHDLDINLPEAILQKLEKNREKYPREEYRGKYKAL